MQYPFWYVLAHRRGERYDLTPLYIGGVHIYGLYGSSVQAATNHRTRHVSVDRDTEITLIRTIARSLLESSTDDLYQPALGIVFRRTCPLRDGAAIVWYRLTLSLRANAGRGMYRRCQHGF